MGKYIGIRGGATALLENQVAHLTHDLLLQTGVLDIAGNHWKVSEHNPQDMSVDVAAGRGYFKKPSMTYSGFTDATENIAITPNNSGNPRIDAVVIYVDLGVTPNADASNVLKFMVVQGTPASSPIPPDDAAIQNAIGSGNPFTRLANVAVANGATSIQDANISDTRTACYIKIASGLKDTELISNKSSGTYQKGKQISSSSSVVLDCSDNNVFEITMQENITLTESGMKVGQFIQIDLIQDATGGRTVTWFSGISWPDGIAPVLTSTPNKRDSFVIKKIGTGSYIGYIVAQNL